MWDCPWFGPIAERRNVDGWIGQSMLDKIPVDIVEKRKSFDTMHHSEATTRRRRDGITGSVGNCEIR